jgi:hypothetical protein
MDQIKIKNIPFVHGGFNLSDHLNSILRNGLIPIGRNIKPIDKAAGNGNCVSLRLARIHGHFGNGEILIVNPDISNPPGVRFYTRELYGIGNDIRRYLQNTKFERPDSICRIDELIAIISSVAEKIGLQGPPFENSDQVFNELLRSPEFCLYLSSYALSKDEFYNIFEEKCRLNSCTLKEFFKRIPYSNMWLINEDICVPNVINPEYILGSWDGKKFTDYKRNLHSSTQKMFEKFIIALKQR